jgi:hypothetical protein
VKKVIKYYCYYYYYYYYYYYDHFYYFIIMQATKGQPKNRAPGKTKRGQEQPSGNDANPGSSIVEGSMLGTTVAKFEQPGEME